MNLSSAEKRKTEIIRALKCVLSDMSAFFVDGFSDLFGVRFSDRLTKIFKWAELSWRISLTYFMEILTGELKSCDYYWFSYDESLNETTQICQMGVPVRCWSKSENQICVYVT